jgi:hypothetical protein
MPPTVSLCDAGQKSAYGKSATVSRTLFPIRLKLLHSTRESNYEAKSLESNFVQGVGAGIENLRRFPLIRPAGL